MKKLILMVCLAVFLACTALSAPAAAHGTHIWFVSPEPGTVIEKTALLEVKAPYAKNRYIHLRITREGDEQPTWKGLVALADHKYTAQVDVTGWEKGTYKHPVTTEMVVK